MRGLIGETPTKGAREGGIELSDKPTWMFSSGPIAMNSAPVARSCIRVRFDFMEQMRTHRGALAN
jgi:hypothetical protein